MSDSFVHDVAIVGAGPAGVFCALSAARRGLRVLLLDSQDSVGRKLALAGGGRGNITNQQLDPAHYTGSNPNFCVPFLKQFNTAQALALLQQCAVPWEERDFGQIFGLVPASQLALKLVALCREYKVDIRLGVEVTEIVPSKASREGASLFTLSTGMGSVQAAQVVLASGSPAFPQCGASDSGASLARKLGHEVIPFRPALVPLRMPDNWTLHGLEGISVRARIAVLPQNGGPEQRDPCDVRSLLFTHQGLSGPAALVASCFWHKGDSLSIDFLPDSSVLELLHEPKNGKLLLKNLLARHLPARLADKLTPPELAERKSAELSKKERQRLVLNVHQHRVTPTESMGMKKAEAAAGGVATAHLDGQLQSRLVPGLFFCGELVDITGLLGGYNIHWALASAWAVGKALR
jgi:predicted Rossmann fold flavoprotein